jgi:hypothetical protein
MGTTNEYYLWNPTTNNQKLAKKWKNSIPCSYFPQMNIIYNVQPKPKIKHI